MNGVAGIEGLSFSFTLGVAAGTLSGACPGVSSTLSLSASAFLLLWMSGRLAARRSLSSPLPYLLLFAILGFYSYSLCAIPSGAASPFSGMLSDFTSYIDSIPFGSSDSAALVKALLSGDRTDIPPEITSSFRAAGASHILALSGLHLGVIYGVISFLLKFIGNSRLSQLLRSLVCVTFCAFYTVLTGASPSTVRALLFIILHEAQKLDVRRKTSSLKIYFTAMLFQTVLTPGAVRSLGFQLSYLAMLGIIVVFPRLKGWFPDSGTGAFDRVRPAKLIWNSAALSISCQLFTAPLIWLRFGTFPRYFLLTNLLALPLAELLILCSLAVLLLSKPGICPPALVSAADYLSSRLVMCLELISKMQG